MTVYAITVIDPTIVPLTKGRVRRLRRPATPASSLARAVAGDLLWIREPFRFRAEWDGMSPTQAIAKGAVPHFTASLNPGAVEMLGLGKKRNARELPRIAHRQHLYISAVSLEPIQSITEQEMRAEGFENRNAWVNAWDESMKQFGRDQLWSTNPEVLVFDVSVRAQSVPAASA